VCNRFRGLKEWTDLPPMFTAHRPNFEHNPNVAPTERVPAFLAERSSPGAIKLAR
jgi:putative SOS response-associated peptidase YedK